MASTAVSVDAQGTPRTRISIQPEGSPDPGKEFDAVIDTGFTGFVQMPVPEAEAIGLVAVGEMAMTSADGSTLVGVHFLRLFEKTLVFSASEGRGLLVTRPISGFSE